MTYFFPYRYTNITAANATIAESAITASFTASLNTVTNAAFHADTVLTSGPSGSIGPTSTSASCATANPGVFAPQGPSGSIGPSGSRGPSLTSCPPGSVACTSLTPPTGYALVCIQTGSCGGISVCPDILPT